MGRGGGSSGHSSGSSHSHNSGSHGSSHSHSASRGGSYSSGPSRGRSSGGMGGPRRPTGMYGGPRGPMYGGPVRGGYREPRLTGRTYSRSSRGVRWFTILVIIIILAAMFFPTGSSSSKSSSGSIPASTAQREKVNTKNAYINDDVIDEIGWISNKTKLSSNLKYFYQKTGCQPYIILKAYDSQYDSQEARENWSKNYYDTHFSENQNVVLYTYFCDYGDNGNGNDTLYVGTESSVVMDSEAQEIFWSYLDYYWDNWDTNDNDGMFNQVFKKTADRIMTVSKTSNDVKYTGIVVGGVIIVGGMIVVLIYMKNKRDKEKAQETIDILNAPLESTADDLADKYTSDQSTDKYTKGDN